MRRNVIAKKKNKYTYNSRKVPIALKEMRYEFEIQFLFTVIDFVVIQENKSSS